MRNTIRTSAMLETGTYFFLFCAFLLIACENDISKVNSITANAKFPAESAKNIEILYSDSGHVKIKITSPLTQKYKGKSNYLELPKGVQVVFYNKDLKIMSRLKSNYAIRYEEEARMEAKQDVVVVNEKGETLNTEHLVWDERKHLIYTEAFVKITTPEQVIYGDGLEANEDFSRYKIKNIKGTINLKDQTNGN